VAQVEASYRDSLQAQQMVSEKAQARVSVLEDQIASMQRSLASLRQQNAAYQATLSTMASARDHAHAMLNEHASGTRELQDVLEEMQEELRRRGTVERGLRQELGEQQRRIDEMSAHLAAAVTTQETMRRQISQYLATIAQLKEMRDDGETSQRLSRSVLSAGRSGEL